MKDQLKHSSCRIIPIVQSYPLHQPRVPLYLSKKPRSSSTWNGSFVTLQNRTWELDLGSIYIGQVNISLFGAGLEGWFSREKFPDMLHKQESF